MLVKLIHSTNSYIYGLYRDLAGKILISDGLAYFYNNRHKEDQFRTSLIDSIKQEDNMLIINTLNSTYQFKVLEGHISELDLTSIEANRSEFERYKALEKEKYIAFFCQVGGNPLIDNAISVTALPKPMTKAEAKEYLDKNVLLDNSGNIVINILSPIEEPK